ncbi:MAG: hypothetical protein EZS28_039494 [Streblomastix strix]|uniref:Secreted protein n=1 Tax=Streblomastix strix TaxID=222440 RepID=A0A5J4U3R7_9EUKA|nr:MAG: hypothetical protein EZS28_039494 [Streblomastix strix]
MLLYDVAQVHFFFCVFQVSCVSFADVVCLYAESASCYEWLKLVFQCSLCYADTIIGMCDSQFSDEFEKSFEFADVSNFFSLYKPLLFPYFVTSLDLNHIGGCIGSPIIQTRNVPSTEHEQRNLPHPDMSMPGMLFSWPWRRTMNVDACISEGECNM